MSEIQTIESNLTGRRRALNAALATGKPLAALELIATDARAALDLFGLVEWIAGRPIDHAAIEGKIGEIAAAFEGEDADKLRDYLRWQMYAFLHSLMATEALEAGQPDNGITLAMVAVIETPEFLRNEVDAPRIRDIVLSPENVGQVEAVNTVWGASDADRLGKLDNDCLVTPGWTRPLARAHTDVPALGVVACWHYFQDDFDEARAAPRSSASGSTGSPPSPNLRHRAASGGAPGSA